MPDTRRRDNCCLLGAGLRGATRRFALARTPGIVVWRYTAAIGVSWMSWFSGRHRRRELCGFARFYHPAIFAAASAAVYSAAATLRADSAATGIARPAQGVADAPFAVSAVGCEPNAYTTSAGAELVKSPQERHEVAAGCCFPAAHLQRKRRLRVIVRRLPTRFRAGRTRGGGEFVQQR